MSYDHEIKLEELGIWKRMCNDPDSHLWWFLDYRNKSEEFIRNYVDIVEVNWASISCNPTLSEKFYEDFSDKIFWEFIWNNPNISESFVEKYIEKVCWRTITFNYGLPESFFEKHLDKIDWVIIALNKGLPESFFERHFDKVNGGWCVSHHLSDSFIRKCYDYFSQSSINQIQKLY